jgi:hypothetical protein
MFPYQCFPGEVAESLSNIISDISVMFQYKIFICDEANVAQVSFSIEFGRANDPNDFPSAPLMSKAVLSTPP